jgi:general nucleoside transport system ATP-binding protein
MTRSPKLSSSELSGQRHREVRARQVKALPVLKLTGITKRFGSLVAVNDVSLDVAPGEVLALLGENGAGKSTLVSILFGHYRADAGRIEVNGSVLSPGNPKAALAAGIAMVHQHFTLADNLSVLDNVMLGTEPLWQLFSRRARARAALQDTAQRYGLQVNPDALVADLSVGERQRVEILKALMPRRNGHSAKILILDEPTAMLTPSEVESLFATLQQLVVQGLSVIFISHKLDEVMRASHRVAVLRGGKLVATVATVQASRASLAELMVGREITAPKRLLRQLGELVCALTDVSVRPALLNRINLTLHAGEIVAIAGVAGNGQQALAELLFGLRAADEGAVELNGSAMPATPQAWVQANVARIPEDRHAVGVVGDMAVWENAVLERYATPAFARWGLTRRASAQSHARAMIESFDVRGIHGQGQAQGLSTPTRLLSGGNMQKLILGRALSGDGGGDMDANPAPLLIVADQPTWGLDVGAVAFVHQQLLDACAQGSAVLLISEDLDEIFALADRVAVMHNGVLGEGKPTREWSLPSIGLAMAGADRVDEQLHAH